MTEPPAGADVRGFYRALGVELPATAQRQASVRCFADPDAHAHEDRNPSCSISLETGAWRCWGCGAQGGAFDAALARGLSSRAAFELKVAHGLAERTTGPRDRAPRDRGSSCSTSTVNRPAARSEPPALDVDTQELAAARARLAALSWPPSALRDEHRRVWTRQAVLELGCGWERGRLLIPITDGRGELRGLLRYASRHDRTVKMLAAPGTRLGLLPHPGLEPSSWVLLVEGPPDMIAARSRGLPALAVPGTEAWEPGWAQLLAGRSVSIAFDCDNAGRRAARRVARDLAAADVHGRIINLAPQRDDGYDLTDWLDARQDEPAAVLRAALASPTPARSPTRASGVAPRVRSPGVEAPRADRP